MRFEKLLLTAFGPFTDEVLDLSGGEPGGLHVVYGPNEAGKSTSLRAVTGFLFGIPHRTGDAHLHPSNRLSVGAVLSSEGQTYNLTRLKRRKDDLVNGDGNPVATNPLPDLLANLDERSFTSRFGLDQAELERGAEALLGGSEQGLFAAGTAGAEVRRVIETLGARTDELYKPRGSKPLLNKALSDYDLAAREARRAERPPEKWLEQNRAYEEAKARVAQLKKERNSVRVELRRLNRLRGLMSDLTAWEQARERRAELGEEPALPDDASQVRQESERKLQEAGVEQRHLSAELEAFERELAELAVESPLAEVDDEQLQLSARAGTAISARKDLPKRQASLLEQVRQVRELLSDIGQKVTEGAELEQARALLPSARTITLVRSLLAEHGALVTAVEVAEKSYAASEREVSRLEEPGGAPAPSEQALVDLEAAHADAQADQGLVASLRDDEEALAEHQAEVGRIRAELGELVPWRELAPLLPTAGQVAAAVSRYREAQSQRESQQQAVETRRQQVEALRSKQLEQAEADLPSEQKLLEARRARDEKLTQWERSTSGEGAAELRGAIAAADQLSDRLRLEADRVAAAVALSRELRDAEAQLSHQEERLAELGARIDESVRAHGELCVKLGLRDPGGPEDAGPLLEKLRRLVDVESRYEALVATMSDKEERLAHHVGRLRLLLNQPPAEEVSLPGLLVAAARELRDGLQAQERARQRGEGLARAHALLEESARERARATEGLETWEDRWEEAVAPLGLRRESSIAVAQDVLSTFEKMARVLQEADNLERRIAGMERDTESLAEDVRNVLRRHLPELLEMDPVDAAVQLQEAIRSARRVRDERRRYRELIDARRASLAKVEARRATCEGRLASLVKAAGVASLADLPQAEERRREIRALREKLETLERAIREKADGASLEELQEEAAEWRGRAGTLNQRVYELEERSEELEEELRGAESDESGTKLGLEIYASEDVVQARQRATTRASEARELLREYLVTQAAQTLLRQQMESYAERFAGPIAGRAGEIFERMTLGRYSKLSIGLGERTLRCVRDGQELEVSQLSRGTRAQLYFALRLASLESYFAEQPAVPLVFDDLFVDFDDDRATAAFEILAELAKRVQVLYFTHLARDVEAAHNAVASNLLFEHRLGVA